MQFRIHANGAVAIYEQIVAQIIYGVATGTLETGGLIPSVRDLAQTLLVHPNTVARAYQELERDGIVTARRGVGMEVTEGAQSLCQAKRRALVQGHISQALREAGASGLTADEIRRLVEGELATVNGKKRK